MTTNWISIFFLCLFIPSFTPIRHQNEERLGFVSDGCMYKVLYTIFTIGSVCCKIKGTIRKYNIQVNWMKWRAGMFYIRSLRFIVRPPRPFFRFIEYGYSNGLTSSVWLLWFHKKVLSRVHTTLSCPIFHLTSTCINMLDKHLVLFFLSLSNISCLAKLFWDSSPKGSQKKLQIFDTICVWLTITLCRREEKGYFILIVTRPFSLSLTLCHSGGIAHIWVEQQIVQSLLLVFFNLIHLLFILILCFFCCPFLSFCFSSVFCFSVFQLYKYYLLLITNWILMAFSFVHWAEEGLLLINCLL
jgi:hypothetical protein